MRAILICLLIVATTQQGFSQTFIGKQKDIDKILANIEAFSQPVMNGDYGKIAATYTSDGKIYLDIWNSVDS